MLIPIRNGFGVRAGISSALIILIVGQTASAQIDQRLLQRGFSAEPHWADTTDEPTFIFGGNALNAETGEREDLDIFYWDSTGRIKFDRDERDPQIWLGYRALTIAIGGDFPQVTGDLNDIAVVAAFSLNERGLENTWRFDFSAGAGTANDGHWSNTDAIYGIGTVNASRQLDSDTILNVGVSYHGNRNLFPDFPLPYVTLQQRVNASLSYELGVLNGGVRWEVIDNLRIQASYVTASSLTAGVTFDVSDDWSLFCEYKYSMDGFFLNDRNNTRVFYERSQIAAGIGFDLGTATHLRLGGGYAFDQDFSTGFDLRDQHGILSSDEGALAFLTIEGTF